MADDDEPLVLATMNCTFSQLQKMVQQIKFYPPAGTAKHLPSELSTYVSNFLTVKKVMHDEVEAVAASSEDSPHKLAECLVDNDESWWMSRHGSMPAGRGGEYVEFRLAKRPVLRRLVAVHIRIPPLPQGPLSVREFRVDVADEEGHWRQLPTIFVVDNREGMQRFPLGGDDIDAHSVRIVCLSNQICEYLITTASRHIPEMVGFYAVRLE